MSLSIYVLLLNQATFQEFLLVRLRQWKANHWYVLGAAYLLGSKVGFSRILD